MPRTINSKNQERIAVNLPKSIVDEIDRLTHVFSEYHWNRQQFVETAIRDTIFKFQEIEAGKSSKKGERISSEKLVQSLDAIVAHTKVLTDIIHKLEQQLKSSNH